MTFSPRRWTAPLAILAAAATPAHAAGDLLVAPTRVVLDGTRGAEVFLKNEGTEVATYRVSLELRRMTPEGTFADVAAPTAAEQAALGMIAYAPRRVTLPPGQPQSIRIGVRAPAGLADGEYRVHMLFRAVPDAKPAAEKAAGTPSKGISIALVPIYGVTIPIIVRRGRLTATAAISNPKLLTSGGKQAVSFTLARAGTRSTYGDIRVIKPGQDKPAVFAKGVAVYHEIASRTVTLAALPEFTGSLAGPATIQYLESAEDGGRVIAEAKVVLR